MNHNEKDIAVINRGNIDSYEKTKNIKSKKDNISYNDDIVLNEINYDNKSFFEDIIFEMKQVLSEYEINIILLHDIYNYTFKELSKKYKFENEFKGEK